MKTLIISSLLLSLAVTTPCWSKITGTLDERVAQFQAQAASNPFGNSALQLAILNNDEEVVARLIALGADVNAIGNFGDYPIHSAIVIGNKNIVAALIAGGANKNNRGKNDKKAKELATDMGRTDIADIII